MATTPAAPATIAISSARSYPRESSCAPSSSALATRDPSSHSLFVTCRILSVINALRKRVTRQAHSRTTKTRTKAKARRAFCQDIDLQACDQIDKYLGRKTVHPARGQRECKDSEQPSRLLQKLDQAVNVNNHALVCIAKDNYLFVGRRANFRLEKLSLKELFELAVTAKALLESLRQADPSCGGGRIFIEGEKLFDTRLDDTSTANLEHLLLCLQYQLRCLLVAKCIDIVRQHLSDCQKDRRRHSEAWFFEFPNARHPESTTWPWSLKPSLAVIWGVCWMFYGPYNFSSPLRDRAGNIVDGQGRILVPYNVVAYVQQQRRVQQQQPASYPPEGGQNLLFGHPRQAWTQPITMAQLGPHPTSVATQPHAPQAASFRLAAFPPPHQHLRYAHRAPDQAAHAPHSLAPATSNAYGAAPQTSSAWPPLYQHAQWLPQDTLHFGLNTSQANAYPAASDGVWSPSSVAQSQPSFHVAAAHDLPPRSRALTPQIRLITADFANFDTPQPQEHIYSASSGSSTALREATYSNDYSTHLHADFMTQVQAPQAEMHGLHQHAHTTSPPSPPSPHHDPAIIQGSRKRSHSEMEHQPMPYEVPPQPYPPLPHLLQQQLEDPRSRAGSVGDEPAPHTGSPGEGDDFSPRGSRSFKRGDPPVNEQNKYFCDFAIECESQTFDRKCEWSKHMDKHDRPYRCPHTQCGKLQGFTYSGGLLRHEREVHGKHGGPKAQLMCPYDDCKRHAGKGFTRKENLNEHIRRVHNDKPTPPNQQDHEAAAFKADLQEAIAGAEHAPMAEEVLAIRLPYPDPAPAPEQYIPEPAEMGKRRRMESERDSNIEDFKQREIERLLTENEEQAVRMREMETREAQLVLRLNQLEHTLRTMHGMQQVNDDDAMDNQSLAVLAVAEQTERSTDEKTAAALSGEWR
ncbi:hypothetical protein LTR53_012655 [Teratosphaeriaceae sp. CCFEE 6253]|nr:hypothetical protein LTR53_012655 [Teratosphaeriaceae sp. CCFEE 6253]